MRTTTTTTINHSSHTVCNGFFHTNGTWNDGFICPIENSIQYICCGTDSYRYCCPPNVKIDSDLNFDVTYSPILDNLLAHEISSALINNRKIMSKQFEEFQRYFLPIFLLSTTVLFLLGIAIWFWLYKHKAFYSLEQDDLTELQTTQQRALSKPKVHFNLPDEQKSTASVYSTTEL
ncbi:unnamed protein product [Adineta ricciae]|uniref:Shisa N-terminal domain-containing protein n=1 Tax=Adineta ricciae TaxID=249248 RepID=A0A814TGB8_ADIRI|nr:unnamed protein product [Adineta ricciae]